MDPARVSLPTAPFAWPLAIERGEPSPLGATVQPDGVNFALFSHSAEAVELLLFGSPEDEAPRQVIRFDPRHQRTFNYWHVFVRGAGPGLLYAYRVFGPDAPGDGQRFNPRKVLVDPYARGIVYDERWSHEQACAECDNVATAMKSLVIDTSDFDWRGVAPPRLDRTQRVIYEMHVRGFTRHPSSGVAHPGTFAGLIEKIPYLVDLGVTTVELLPVFQFDEANNPRRNPFTGEQLRDYWGYNPLGFFAPHRGYYREDWSRMRHLTGFRELVRALHAAGLEVFLDVVFNHTAEGGEGGPQISFKGLENQVYYLLDPADRRRYLNYSGCGNTVNSNHPVVRRLILDSLRYWTEVMHVDGFRFDLAAILSRDAEGRPLRDPPLIWEIESDPVLRRVKLIAEAWDAAGLYQVGTFPGERWAEWNGHFRDDVRRFLRGDHGLAGAMAARLLGSPDLYEHHRREPSQSVNYITCHDGFTLSDLVTWSGKRNLANGEDGRDGTSDEHSAHYGHEGPSDDPALEALRDRQVKNALALLLLAQGTPMLSMGDEVRRSQGGNNNAWCQDNPISWLDWGLLERHAEVHRFTRLMIRFRRAHPSLSRRHYLHGVDAPPGTDPPGTTQVRWHGVRCDEPDWGWSSRVLSYTLTEAADDVALHVIANMHTDPLSFELPPPAPGRRWWRAIDTGRASPQDALEPGREVALTGLSYQAGGRSVVVLLER